MEAHLIRPAHFTGMSCTAYQRREPSPGGLGAEGERAEPGQEQPLRFRCTTGTHNTSLHSFPLKVSGGAAQSDAAPTHDTYERRWNDDWFQPDAPPMSC